jgi:hypothetical protein
MITVIHFKFNFLKFILVVQDILAIAGGYDDGGKLSQSWAIVGPDGLECTGNF